MPKGRQSEGATSPERIAYTAPASPNLIKHRKHPNTYIPLAEGSSQESVQHNDNVREGSISDASTSRGNRLRDPISLAPKILAMMDRHEPAKGKQAQLLTKHLAGQMIMSFTKEEI